MERRKPRDPFFLIRWFFRVTWSGCVRFYWDDCFSRAAALSYTTLFALVPVTTLGISMLRVFGFEGEQLQLYIKKVLEQVLPTMENAQMEDFQFQIFSALQQFTSNVAALNAISIALLAFTSIALLNTIESALNVIWRVSSNLTLLEKIFSFWAVITLGLPLIAISIYWTTQATALAQSSPWFYDQIFRYNNIVLPVIVSWVALTMLFYKMPAAPVQLRDAATGAFLASILFEAVKRGFAYYVSVSAGYSKVYGVIATIPLFLFWMYIAWVIVLYGAEVAYQAGSIKLLSGRKKYTTDLGEVGGLLGLRILYCIGEAFAKGMPPLTEGEIAIKTGSDPVLVRTGLDMLTKAGVLSAEDPKSHARTLVISPEALKVGGVLTAFRTKDHDTTHLSDEGEGEISLLEILHRVSLTVGSERLPEQWTLSEFIGESRGAEVQAPASESSIRKPLLT